MLKSLLNAMLFCVGCTFVLHAAKASEDMVVKSGSAEPVLVALDPNPRPVIWSESIGAAQRIASEKQRPFIIYFCSEDQFPVAGGDLKAFANYRKSHAGDSPDWTVFDSPRMTAEMNKIGIASYVKIADTKDNAKLFMRYGATAGMVIYCTPDGEKFTGSGATQTDVLNALFSLHERYLDWRDSTPKPDVALVDSPRFR